MHRKFGEVLYLVSPFHVLLYAESSFAAIPLITDDAGTQGKGNYRLELFAEYGQAGEASIAATMSALSAVLTYGVIDAVDIILGIPYQAWSANNSGAECVLKGNGLADLALEAKWRFYEKEGLRFALKPGFTIPTGDEKKGLGAGRPTYYLLLIATKGAKPCEFDMNVGHLYNANSVGERKNIWSASLDGHDGQDEAVKNLKSVLDTGMGTNPDSSSNTPPVFILGGLIWSLRENLDIGLGVKGGLTTRNGFSRPWRDNTKVLDAYT